MRQPAREVPCLSLTAAVRLAGVPAQTPPYPASRLRKSASARLLGPVFEAADGSSRREPRAPLVTCFLKG